MDNLIGKRIENFRIDSLLGEGGMGAVYRALDVNLARNVAVKIMHRQLAKQPQFQQRFMQEAQAVARLNHPSIVTIYSFDNKNGLLYIVMEFIKGMSLGRYIKQLAQRQQVVQLNETMNIIAQSADALGYAHRQGVIHRDIKPDNILIKPLDQPERSGEPPMRAVLTDFGLAKLLEGGVETATGTFMGTLPYMSPEQALAKPIDGRSDIYSLGVVLYQLATGRLPFDIKTPTEAVMKHMNETPPDPRQVQPGLPIAVKEVIDKTLAKDPADRFPSAEAFAASLRQAMTTLTDQDVTTFETAADYAVVSLVTQLESGDQAEIPSRMEPDETFQGGIDRLVVSQKGESPRAYAMDKEILTLGRTDDNDIELSGQGVSRHHARLQRTAAGWQIIDTGSTNGTLLEGVPLLPDVAEPWDTSKTIQIGPFFLQWSPTSRKVAPGAGVSGPGYKATSLYQVPPGGSQIHSSTGQLSVVVNPTNVDVTPGSRADLQVELFNQGVTVDHFQVNIGGIPSPWVTVPQEPLQLMPGSQGSLPVSIHPPQASSATAGQHNYRLSVTSMSNAQESATVSGTVNVKPFERFSTDMRPKKVGNKGICRVLVRNEGNFDATYRIAGRDAGEAIRFMTPQQAVPIPAGQSKAIDVNLEPKKRPFLGRSQTYPFTIAVGTSTSEKQTIPGQMEVRPIVPPWLPGFLGALLAIICLVAAGAFYFINQENNNATSTALALAGLQNNATQTAVASMTAAAEGTAAAEQAAAATATSLAATALAEGDDDQDGLSNNQEISLGTNPQNADTDGDGLSDGAEVNQFGTDPKNQDHDGDTVSDGDEVNIHGTSPLNPDTDADGTPDGIEINAGSNPLLPPTATPPPANTPTPTPVITPTPNSGVWDGTWNSECEYLSCGEMELRHVEGEQTVTGTFAGGDGTIVGIFKDDRLSGTWSFAGENGSVDFWLADDGKSWQGNWDKTANWCGYRAGQSKPEPCGVASWYGEWDTACGLSSCAVMTITQDGEEVEGTYANGAGSMTGTVSGTVLTGDWVRGSTGTLRFFLNNENQFNGNWDGEFEWCGYRSGTGLPDPCLNQGFFTMSPIFPQVLVTLQPSLPTIPLIPIFPIITPTP